MKVLSTLFFCSLVIAASAHPGGGIVALSEHSALVADPTENFIWLVEVGQEPKRLVSKFHGHWLTRGRDGNLYTEAFQERGGAWATAAFRLDLSGREEVGVKVREIADHRELGVLVYTVDRDGSLVFQRGDGLVTRRDGKESVFRPTEESKREPKLTEVTAYAWSDEGDLIFADRNSIWRVDSKGDRRLVTEIEGKVLEPKIWNGIEVPMVFGLALEKKGDVLATVPHLAKVYRISRAGQSQEVICADGSWRATGVSVFGDSIFLMESDARASTSPRVRILRADGKLEILTLPPRSR